MKDSFFLDLLLISEQQCQSLILEDLWGIGIHKPSSNLQSAPKQLDMEKLCKDESISLIKGFQQ